MYGEKLPITQPFLRSRMINTGEQRLAICGELDGRFVMYDKGLLYDITPETVDEYGWYADHPHAMQELQALYKRDVKNNPAYCNLKVQKLQVSISIVDE